MGDARPVLFALAAVGLALPAHALEQRGRVRVDYQHLTESSDGAPDAQLVGYGLRWSGKDLARLGDMTLELHFDGRAREDLVRDRGTRREIAALNAVLRDVGPVDLRLGRFAFGEGTGFLLVDGGEVEVEYTDYLAQSFVGGLRAEFDDLTPDRDRPTVGTALRGRVGEWLDAAATVSYTRERYAPGGREDEGEHDRDILTAAARALAFPHPTVWLFVSAEVSQLGGYSIPPDDPTLWSYEDRGFSLVQGFAQVGYRPIKPLKLDLAYLLSDTRFAAPSEEDVFQDISARVRWRFYEQFRAMGRVRLRARDRVSEMDDGGRTTLIVESERGTRFQAGVDLADILDTHIGVNASWLMDTGGYHDKQSFTGEAGYDDGVALFGYVGYRTTIRDPGDEFSSFSGDGDAPDTVYPYARAVTQAAYMRAGWRRNLFFAQLTADQDLGGGGQTLVFAQTGYGWR